MLLHVLAALGLPAIPGRLFAATYYVNTSAPGCSDIGPGTPAVPYCTIAAASAARWGPGTTILVSPGVYREQINITASGAQGNPFTLAAAGPQVVLEGTDDLSAPSAWQFYSGNVWRAAGVTWNPLQVFVDGARLTLQAVSPAALSPGAFVYVSGQGLYVNIGGPSPGTRQTMVGRRASGFRLTNASWVNIDGFVVLRSDDRGISVTNGSGCEITGNTVQLANKFGIAAYGASNLLVRANLVSQCADHGLYMSGVTGSNILENESSRNARPNVRAANGIQLYGSSGNAVQRNRLHDNQDSGLQINSSSNNNLSIQNMSWNNGDHGFDHLTSTGTMHLGDVAYRNFKDGFSIEGSSPSSTVVNCIGVDNGLTTNEFDLWVDSSSSSGLVSNSNIFWNSTSQVPVKYMSTAYASLAAYAWATGQDSTSVQANPLFVDPANGDFRLSAGSPAIDCADSSIANWPVTDAAGTTRFDDLGISNRGRGSVTFADRGAMEFTETTPTNAPPEGVIDTPATSSTILVNQSIVFSGSASDPDGPDPMTYAWSFGGGAQNQTVEDPGPVVFTTPGTYTVTFTATDAAGAADPTPDVRVITVEASSNLIGNPSFEASTSGWSAYGGSTLQRVAGGQDGTFSIEVRAPASVADSGINDTPNWISATSAAGTRYRITAYVRSATSRGVARLRVREYLSGVQIGTNAYVSIPLSPAWQLLTLDFTTQRAGSNLDLQIFEQAAPAGDVFQIDSISTIALP